jgi:hypothetical protein
MTAAASCSAQRHLDWHGELRHRSGAVQPGCLDPYPAPGLHGSRHQRHRSLAIELRGIAYVDAPSLYPNDESGYVKLRYNSAGSTSNQTETHPFAPSFKLVPGVNAQVVTGTVLLSIRGAISPGVTTARAPCASSPPVAGSRAARSTTCPGTWR